MVGAKGRQVKPKVHPARSKQRHLVVWCGLCLAPAGFSGTNLKAAWARKVLRRRGWRQVEKRAGGWRCPVCVEANP